MFLQPVAEGGIHAALPTLAGGFESIENVVVEPDGSRFLLPCSWRSAAHGLFDRFLCFFTRNDFFFDRPYAPGKVLVGQLRLETVVEPYDDNGPSGHLLMCKHCDIA
jgi:hypothetical protein